MDYCYYLPVPYRPCQSKLFVNNPHVSFFAVYCVKIDTVGTCQHSCHDHEPFGCIVISLGQSTSQRVRKTYMAEEITTKVWGLEFRV